MVEITTIKKHEILFLKSHPKGPKMILADIAKYLSIHENIVRAICSEEGLWNYIFQDTLNIEPKGPIKNSLSPSGDFEFINASQAEDKDKMISDFSDKIAKLEEEIRKNAEDMKADKLKMDANEKENAGMVLVNKEHWIHLCHIDYYDQLEKQLDINKSSARDLCEPLNELYSMERFTASVHKDLLASIEYQKRLMDTMKSTFFGFFRYNAETSIQGLLMKINDLLNHSVPGQRVLFAGIESRSSPWCM